MKDPVPLPDIDCDDFAQFLSWAYGGKIGSGRVPGTWTQYCRLWVLADKLKSRTFQDHIVRQGRRKYKEEIEWIEDPRTASNIFKWNSMSSRRDMVVDFYWHFMQKDRFEDIKKELPRELLEDICNKWVKSPEGASVKDRDPPPEKMFEFHRLVSTFPVVIDTRESIKQAQRSQCDDSDLHPDDQSSEQLTPCRPIVIAPPMKDERKAREEHQRLCDGFDGPTPYTPNPSQLATPEQLPSREISRPRSWSQKSFDRKSEVYINSADSALTKNQESELEKQVVQQLERLTC